MNIETKMTMPVHSPFDVISARLKIRQWTSDLGYGLIEQAAISLATWSVATSLGMGTDCRGEIVAEEIYKVERAGVQVACRAPQGDKGGPKQAMKEVEWVVDEVFVETPTASLPSEECIVTVIKWKI